MVFNLHDQFERLREEGKFTNTAVLYEGIQGWVSLGYPVVAGDASKPKP